MTTNYQGYISNYASLNKNFNIYKILYALKYKKILDRYPVLYDFRINAYFITLLRLTDFLHNKSDLSLQKLIYDIKDISIKSSLDNVYTNLIISQYYTDIFVLRNKFVAHRDNYRYKNNPDIPEGILEMYINLINDIIKKSFESLLISFPEENNDNVASLLILMNLLDSE